MTGKKKVIAAICGVLCLGTALAAGGCNKGGGKEPEDQAPVISVETKDEFASKQYTVGKPMAIPKATALDNEDGTLDNKVKLKVFFSRSGENVLLDGEEEEVNGNVVTTFTPTKCGNYKAIYTVRDSGGNITREEIPFTVVASGEERAHQVLSAEERENWVLDGKGSAFNSEGAIALTNDADASVSYKGKKLKSGDLVEFRFNAQQGTSRRYFTIGGFLSRSYLEDAPAENESQFAKGYLYVLVTDGMYEIWLSRGVGYPSNDPLTRQSYNMFDGKDHTIAYRVTLQEEGLDGSVLFEVWIDEEVTNKASFSQTIYASELMEYYETQAATAFASKFADAPEQYTMAELKAFVGEEFDAFYADMFEEGATDDTTIALADLETKFKAKYSEREFNKVFGDMFDEEKLGGYFNAGAAGGNAQIQLKAVGFNGEQKVGAPTLAVDFEEEKVNVIGKAITFPQPKVAEDGNDYSDLKARVKLSVIDKATGESTPLEGYTFTPENLGFYTLVYTVTDYSGNQSFVYHDFSVARTENDQPPVIELSSTDDIETKAGQTVTLPTLVSALDPDNNDFSSVVKVELVGPEAQVVTGTEHVFFTAGEHWIRYSVTDYTGRTTSEEVKVIVTAENDWLLDLEVDSFNSNVEREYDANGKTSALKFYDGYSAGFTKQKIYDEKVSVLLDAHFATGWDAGDGINMIQIGLRSDKYADQNTNVNGVFDKFDWLSGLYMEINTVDGIAVYGGKREGGQIFKVAPSATKSVRDLFDGETVFSYKVTDVYNDAHTRITGIKIEMWINDEPIRLDPDNESDAYVIPARRIQPYMTKSGWLCFYANGSGKNYDPTLIRAVTIDGSTPEVLTATLPEDIAKEAEAGESYTLPSITATLGENAIAEEDIEVYVVPYGSEELGTKKAMGDAFSVGEELYAGFAVVYQYRGRTLARYTVTVSLEVTNIVYSASTEGLKAELNKPFAIPQITSYQIGQTTSTDASKINVKIVYDANPARKAIDVSGTSFTPLEKKGFKLAYYYGEQKISEFAVAMDKAGDIDSLIPTLQPSDYIYAVDDNKDQKLTGTEIALKNNLGNSFLYTAQEFYDEKITVTIDAHLADQWQSPLGGSSVIFFKLRGQPINGAAAFKYWPFIGRGDDGNNRGLYFSLKAKEGFILEYGKRDSNVIKRYNPVTGANDGNAGSYWEKDCLPAGSQISWQVIDVFENGVATGVRVKVWMKAPTAETETVVFDEFVAAEGKPDLFQSYNLLIETYTGYQAGKDDDRGPTMIRNIKVERTVKPEYEASFAGRVPSAVQADEEFTLPAVVLKHNGTLLKAGEYQTFIVGDDEEEVACENAFMIDGKYYGGGFSIVYKYEGKELLRTGKINVVSQENLLENAQADSYVYKLDDKASQLQDGKVALNGSNSNIFLWKQKHFYDEKITVNLDVHLARWEGAGDPYAGADLIAFNLRGKIQHEADPQNWPYIDWNAPKTGLYLSVSTNLAISAKKCGIQLIYVDPNHSSWNMANAEFLSWWDCENGTEGADTGYQGYWEDKYMPAGSDLSWQCTDVFDESGVATGVRVQVWLKKPTDASATLIIDKVVSETREDGSKRGGLFDSYYFIAEASSRNAAGGNRDGVGPTMINSIVAERSLKPMTNIMNGITAEDYTLKSSATYENGTFTVPTGAGSPGFLYKTRQFYDEKISVTLDARLAPAWFGDGASVIAFNLRGDNKTGDSLLVNPTIKGNEDGANKGLWLCMQANEGFRLIYGGRDAGVLKRYNLSKANWENDLMPAGSVLSWKITDVFGDDGTTKTGVQVKVWVKAPGKPEVEIFDEFVEATEGREDLFDEYYFLMESYGTGNATRGPSTITAINVEETTTQD